ncbi:DUF2460 domain-containing protein [Pelagovum pacificum]|uniref:TIGR02217 family protein n=1 Tax=Pelagovum pacificum TaxID=2588711 RepID=A0A5C5GBD2_9RHOB|nr:DUF2460 domain-containing protein [Pelagovum pacificum]QQA41234.1 DUF2460 domain-containing protein [Pelagovum pacificum]TNY31958.1 TIGR02217 family protein [Pelagovum pacificum]
MTFHDVRFPTSLSFGALGGPERRTEIVTLANGAEERNSPWAHSRRRYDAGLGLRSLDDLEALVAFFEARHGQLHAFRWKDWGDYRSCLASGDVSDTDQLLGIGDEVTAAFQLVKRYGSGPSFYERPVKKPVGGTVIVALDGVPQVEGAAWSVDISTGIVTFDHPPDVGVEVTAGFEFDVPVRFDIDRILTSVASFQAGDAPDVPVVEVRL